MKKKNINITISNKDESKSEIVYNNIITNMEKMSLSKDEQIDYLKTRITELEQDQKYKIECFVLGSIFLLVLLFGLFLMIQDFHTIGVIVIVCSFVLSVYFTYKLSRRQKTDLNDRFEEIETIRKLINSKLK